jgi:hypothetical protein
MGKIKAVAVEGSALYPFNYVDYAEYWQELRNSCGTTALNKMEEVSQKYDSQGLFRWQAVGLKLVQYKWHEYWLR